MLLKISIRVAALAAAIAVLSSPLALAAPAHKRHVAETGVQTSDLTCRYVGAISHRCYTFHSDATWREGMPDYHGSNGG